MYYMLQSKYGTKLNSTDPEIPVIVWLQGGPGGSSMFGCFNEVGALYLTGNKTKFKAAESWFSWNNLGHLLCVDQPLNVGYSHSTKNVTDTMTAARHFNNFLYNLLKTRGLKGNPLYLTGESFAGHYIPAIAANMLENRSMGFNLKGLAIGDGWVDPLRQANFYGDFMFAAGVQGYRWREESNWHETQATLNILNYNLTAAAGHINYLIADEKVMASSLNNMSIYNFRITDGEDDEGIINPAWDQFFKDNATKAALGVPLTVPFIPDNQFMYKSFSEDLASSYAEDLAFVLNANVRVLLYNGQNDYIVNTASVLDYLDSLSWRHGGRWKNSKQTTFHEYGEIMGWYKEYEPLTFCLVYGAGHLLPADQPRAAYVMLRNFLTRSFSDSNVS
jgi:cathepsin A (carboxypeptidase C)